MKPEGKVKVIKVMGVYCLSGRPVRNGILKALESTEQFSDMLSTGVMFSVSPAGLPWLAKED